MAKDFSSKLKDHNLTVNNFLDLRDEWNSLSWVTKGLLLNNDNSKERSNIPTEKGIAKFKCCSIYGKEFMIKDIIDCNSYDNILKFKDINGKCITVNFDNILYIVSEDQENEEEESDD